MATSIHRCLPNFLPLLILSVWVTVGVYAGDTADNHITHATVNQGQDIIIRCAVYGQSGAEDSDFSWRKDENALYYGNQLLAQDPRISVEGGGELTIRDANPNDGGVYECSSGPYNLKFSITVNTGQRKRRYFPKRKIIGQSPEEREPNLVAKGRRGSASNGIGQQNKKRRYVGINSAVVNDLEEEVAKWKEQTAVSPELCKDCQRPKADKKRSVVKRKMLGRNMFQMQNAVSSDASASASASANLEINGREGGNPFNKFKTMMANAMSMGMGGEGGGSVDFEKLGATGGVTAFKHESSSLTNKNRSNSEGIYMNTAGQTSMYKHDSAAGADQSANKKQGFSNVGGEKLSYNDQTSSDTAYAQENSEGFINAGGGMGVGGDAGGGGGNGFSGGGSGGFVGGGSGGFVGSGNSGSVGGGGGGIYTSGSSDGVVSGGSGGFVGGGSGGNVGGGGSGGNVGGGGSGHGGGSGGINGGGGVVGSGSVGFVGGGSGGFVGGGSGGNAGGGGGGNVGGSSGGVYGNGGVVGGATSGVVGGATSGVVGSGSGGMVGGGGLVGSGSVGMVGGGGIVSDFGGGVAGGGNGYLGEGGGSAGSGSAFMGGGGEGGTGHFAAGASASANEYSSSDAQNHFIHNDKPGGPPVGQPEGPPVGESNWHKVNQFVAYNDESSKSSMSDKKSSNFISTRKRQLGRPAAFDHKLNSRRSGLHNHNRNRLHSAASFQTSLQEKNTRRSKQLQDQLLTKIIGAAGNGVQSNANSSPNAATSSNSKKRRTSPAKKQSRSAITFHEDLKESSRDSIFRKLAVLSEGDNDDVDGDDIDSDDDVHVNDDAVDDVDVDDDDVNNDDGSENEREETVEYIKEELKQHRREHSYSYSHTSSSYSSASQGSDPAVFKAIEDIIASQLPSDMVLQDEEDIVDDGIEEAKERVQNLQDERWVDVMDSDPDQKAAETIADVLQRVKRDLKKVRSTDDSVDQEYIKSKWKSKRQVKRRRALTTSEDAQSLPPYLDLHQPVLDDFEEINYDYLNDYNDLDANYADYSDYDNNFIDYDDTDDLDDEITSRVNAGDDVEDYDFGLDDEISFVEEDISEERTLDYFDILENDVNFQEFVAQQADMSVAPILVQQLSIHANAMDIPRLNSNAIKKRTKRAPRRKRSISVDVLEPGNDISNDQSTINTTNRNPEKNDIVLSKLQNPPEKKSRGKLRSVTDKLKIGMLLQNAPYVFHKRSRSKVYQYSARRSDEFGQLQHLKANNTNGVILSRKKRFKRSPEKKYDSSKLYPLSNKFNIHEEMIFLGQERSLKAKRKRSFGKNDAADGN